MKIGDKVRFLNDVGGGTISGFQEKGIVLVTDEDGFEIPTLASEVVVVETDNYNIAKKPKKTKAPKAAEASAAAPDEAEEEEEPDLADLELTYQPLPQERRGADALNLHLAFVPQNEKQITDTPCDVYLVNDCNYYVRYALLTRDGTLCHLRHEGELVPNTKTFLEELRPERLEEWAHIIVQTFAYKRDKAFVPKTTLSVPVRIDATKFFRRNSFRPSDFFTTDALVVDIVRDNEAALSLIVDKEALEAQIDTHRDTQGVKVKTQAARTAPDHDTKGEKGNRPASAPAKKEEKGNRPLEVDLHASALLDSVAGLTPRNILDYQLRVFRETMDAHIKERGRRIVFIHGKGEGTLRNALLVALRKSYKTCRAQDASFREYGFGATLVTIG